MCFKFQLLCEYFKYFYFNSLVIDGVCVSFLYSYYSTIERSVHSFRQITLKKQFVVICYFWLFVFSAEIVKFDIVDLE